MRNESKLKRLKDRLRSLRSVLLAYSGGVDSAFLLRVAHDVLGDRVLAVTARSETYTHEEEAAARALARRIGAAHKVIVTRELKDARFRANPRNRCYYCKSELFSRLKALAKKYKFAFVVDGSNVDDFSDMRPGVMAKKEFGIISPLQDVGLRKDEIRALSKKMGLSTWSKPAMACLASRIPYGSPISAKRLRKIENAEAALRKAFSIKGNLRVRDFGHEARIEVDKTEIKRLAPPSKLTKLLAPLGYKSIAIAPQGYRPGTLNETNEPG